MLLSNLMEQALQITGAYEETLIAQLDDSWCSLDEYVRFRNYECIAVFTGRHSAELCGGWSALLNALCGNSCAVERFREIPPEPDMDTVQAMADFLNRIQPDGVIALGGGSVLDAAKAAYIKFQTKMPLADCFGSNSISNRFPGREFSRILAIPTTSGTGSEVTQYANIVNRKLGVKQLISDPVLVPEAAFLAGSLTRSMSRDVTLATGCDALSHLLEGWLNIGMDAEYAFINDWAKTGCQLVLEALPAVLKTPEDPAARKAMQLAAVLGGLTIRRKSTGLPHLASFSWFGRIAHGIATARLLPAAWRYYIGSEKVVARTLEIGKALWQIDSGAEAVIAAYEQFLKQCGVPELADFSELDEDLRERTALGAGANRMKLELAPRPVPLERSAEVLRTMLDDAFQRR